MIEKVIEGVVMSDIVDLELELDGVGDLRMSPEAEQERGGAPPPRRKSFSKLRRRLSQTFRFSFNGSLSEFSHSFAVNDERDRSNGEMIDIIETGGQESDTRRRWSGDLMVRRPDGQVTSWSGTRWCQEPSG